MPGAEVLGRGAEIARAAREAHGDVGGVGEAALGLPVEAVAGGAVRHDGRHVVHRRVAQAERREDAAFHRLGVGQARDLLDDDAEQHIGGVRIAPVGPRLVRQGLAGGLHGLDELGGVAVGATVLQEPPRIDRRVVPQARCVAQHPPQAQPLGIGEVGQVDGEVVVQAELALMGELQDHGGGELLGDRADLADRAAGHGRARLDIGPAEALHEQGGSLARDADRDAGDRPLGHDRLRGRLDPGPARRGLGRRVGLRQRRRGGQAQQSRQGRASVELHDRPRDLVEGEGVTSGRPASPSRSGSPAPRRRAARSGRRWGPSGWWCRR